MKRNIILLFTFYSLSVLFSHKAEAIESKPTIDKISSLNGLTHNTIRDMLQDKTGFMWFGSLNGLNRFDGVSIRSWNPDPKNPNSLSGGKIKKLHEDSRGYIWIRTYSDQMHCYNPQIEDFIALFNNKNDNSKKFNQLFEDKNKNIWLSGNMNGCVRIEIDKNNVQSLHFDEQTKPVSLPSNSINQIFDDNENTIWILTNKGIALYKNNKLEILEKSNRGYLSGYVKSNKVYLITIQGELRVFDVKTKKVTYQTQIISNDKCLQAVYVNGSIYVSTKKGNSFIINTNNLQVKSLNQIFNDLTPGELHFLVNKESDVLMYNSTGNVWIHHNKTGSNVHLSLIPPSIMHLIDEERYQFATDKQGNIWISTYGNGLFSYNFYNSQLTHYSYSNAESGLSSDYLLSLTIDKNENIWVGTENTGVNKLTFTNRNVKLIYPNIQQNQHNSNVVRAFLEDSKGNFWVSTRTGNLYIYDRNFTEPKIVYENKYSVYNMMEDKAGDIWLSTKKDGLIQLKNGKLSGAIQHLNNSNPGSLSYNSVFSSIQDKKGRIWAATFGGGLSVKLAADGLNNFKTFFNSDEWVKFTRYLLLDSKGYIWMGSSYGVYKFNPDSLLNNPKAFKYYSFSTNNPEGLSNPEVRYIYEDSKGEIWLATSGGGVNKYLGETPDGNGRFKAYTNKTKMANDNITAMLEDKKGNIWISSESGLHKLTAESGTFQTYRFTNDLASNIFSETAALKCRDGRMLWGSLNGFYVFNPEDILLAEKKQNKVIITGFKIFDSPARIASTNAPLKKTITLSEKITLKSSDNVFHIEFSDLNFNNSLENQYMFMLENYEKRWNTATSSNSATYRNVPYGTYTFLVKKMNTENDNNSQVTSLIIEIKPPFWLSVPAIIIYILLISAGIFFAYRLIKKINDLNNAVTVERQLTNYKLRFFTNISHEFRTPLTLIKGGIDTLADLRSKMSEPLQHLIDDLNKNTAHLMRLIDQLLEFRKLQNDKLKLNLRITNLEEFLTDIYESFRNVAIKMNIDYQLQLSPDLPDIYVDRNKVDKIIFNLLSNAFKFTRRGGKITLMVEIDEPSQTVHISVADNGIGIPKEKQSMLFSRFMQANFSEKGTGIGLSLVKEFSTLHKGNVFYNENINGGSVFTLALPIDNESYNPEDFLTEEIQIQNDDVKTTVNISEFFNESDDNSLLNLLPIAPVNGKKYKILIIDDNDDIRNFLVEKLSPYFEIQTAADGDSGLKLCKDSDPNLIICDVMMPGMNGFELTKSLKDNFETCHIPVILLTAYVADEHHSEGIEAGAEAYISKPFSMKHLMLQINKLLEKTEKIHQHYASNQSVNIVKEENKLDIPDRDSAFLKMVEDILEQHLSDPEFTVDDFAAMAKTGRTLFFKKVKFLTGYSPNELIRVRRMTKAAELLKTYRYNVSEVSYMVGINDPFYFSKCFKAQFGCSPSHYINN